MKSLLPATLVLSLILNGLLASHLLHQPPVATPPPVVRTVVVEKEKPSDAVFDWKQLEAPDFATYIANLRRAGCPEHTIRSIIQPELRQVVQAQQHEANTRVDEADHTTQETRLMESLLAVQPAEPSVATQTPIAQPEARPIPHPAELPSLTSTAPAAFLIGNAPNDPVLTPEGLAITPSDPSLPPETLQRLGDIRRQFGEQVSSSPASNTTEVDPEVRWRKARRASDDIFIARYGGDYFMQVQQQARLQEALNAQKQGVP
ncbi:MAG: hypothetical protein IPK22_23020 [Verrucomicrobiaceae bacterium]|nr:hypothetical protein [Verrucomicrobiaceae bacterium]